MLSIHKNKKTVPTCFYRKDTDMNYIDISETTVTDSVFAKTNNLAEKYPYIEKNVFGSSVRGKPLEYIKIGKGKKASLFVGAHHAMEYITSFLLLEFAEVFLGAAESGEKIGVFAPKEIFEKRSVYIVPMLNPDGIDIEQGVVKPTQDLIDMNKGSTDFSRWQANARGVDLNHNYDAGFWSARELEGEYGVCGPGPTRFSGPYPESEPESAALCRLTRLLGERLCTVIALHTQGEEIYWDYGGEGTRDSLPLAKRFADLSGYKVSSPCGIASFGGFKDYTLSKLGITSFTIECGMGENPLPHSDFYSIYKKIEMLLFCAASF